MSIKTKMETVNFTVKKTNRRRKQNMEKITNTMETFKNEGFKIIRDGKVIILTNEEMASFRELDQALTGRDCIELFLDSCDFTEEEAKTLIKAMENTTECYEIEQDILNILFEDAGETELEVINSYLEHKKEELERK